MIRGSMTGWRTKSVVVAFALIAACLPGVVLAQTQPAPSGAVVLSGGVSAPSAVQGATRGQPVVLPNTGGPNDQDDNNVATLAVFGGLAAAGAGVYLRRRAAKSRIGG
jgi:membrane anchored protein